MGGFPAILDYQKHPRVLQIIAGISSKNIAVYHDRMFPFLPAITCDEILSYLTGNFGSHITWKCTKCPLFCLRPFENQRLNSRDIPKSGARFKKCWQMHHRASPAIFIHHSSFGRSHCECAASQCVAGPLWA